MKKFISLLIITLIISCFQTSIAETIQPSNYTQDLILRFKKHRNNVYSKLDLTTSQAEQIATLDNDIYLKLTPELEQISLNLTKIDAIANSDNCTIKQINTIKKDFKSTHKKISKIKSNYERKFKLVLNKNQKSLYKTALKEQKAQIKQEIEEFKQSQIHKN